MGVHICIWSSTMGLKLNHVNKNGCLKKYLYWIAINEIDSNFVWYTAFVTSRVRCEEWPTLVVGCIWGLFVKYQNSPEKIKRHITNTDKIQQNAQSLPTHSFIHSFIRSFIHSRNTSHHSCITHSSHCIIPCITHSSHYIPTHHTMHHPFFTLHLNTSYL